jgi:hypothetical protein
VTYFFNQKNEPTYSQLHIAAPGTKQPSDGNKGIKISLDADENDPRGKHREFNRH